MCYDAVELGDFQFHNECKVRSNCFMNFFIESIVEVTGIEKYVFIFFCENLLFRCINTAVKNIHTHRKVQDWQLHIEEVNVFIGDSNLAFCLVL